MPNFKPNPNGMKPSGFKMKYQGGHSAFPFKGSPMQKGETYYTNTQTGETFTQELASKNLPYGGRKIVKKGTRTMHYNPKTSHLWKISDKEGNIKEK